MPVLIILAVLWAVVLVPPLLRSRSQHSADSIVDFNRKLDVLGRTNGNLDDTSTVGDPYAAPVGAASAGPRRRVPPARAAAPVRTAVRTAPLVRASAAHRSALRRRNVVRTLSIAVLATLLVATFAHSPVAWGFQLFVDLLAGAYVGLLAWARGVQSERAEKVRYLPELRVPELALRRTASS